MHADHEQPGPAETERLLDQLVDGELSEAQRRSLLLWCQRDPEGWRRCALAFLEAQAWTQALPAAREMEEPAASPPMASPPGPIDTPLQDQPRRRVGRWGAVGGWGGALAMAASFMLAFSLGLAVNRRPDAVAPRPADAGLAQSSAIPEMPMPEDAPSAPATHDEPEWGSVRLVVDGGPQGKEEFQLPVVEGSTLDQDWLNSHPAPMPAEVQRALERLGGRVEQHRRLVPIQLRDGRRLVVPVDDVEVVPVNRTYQ